ncbi:hypothetical protein Tco_1387697 [Tanacetum coccineum]
MPATPSSRTVCIILQEICYGGVTSRYEARAKSELNKKANSVVIVCLGDDGDEYRCTPRLDLGFGRLIPLDTECTSAIRQMAYEAVPDARDEYLQMGATTARKCLRMFCKAIMELYGEEFMRNPTYTDIEKLYAHNEEKHGFPVMIGSIDYTD